VICVANRSSSVVITNMYCRLCVLSVRHVCILHQSVEEPGIDTLVKLWVCENYVCLR
jgi:hypothetical protein